MTFLSVTFTHPAPGGTIHTPMSGFALIAPGESDSHPFGVGSPVWCSPPVKMLLASGQQNENSLHLIVPTFRPANQSNVIANRNVYDLTVACCDSPSLFELHLDSSCRAAEIPCGISTLSFGSRRSASNLVSFTAKSGQQKTPTN